MGLMRLWSSEAGFCTQKLIITQYPPFPGGYDYFPIPNQPPIIGSYIQNQNPDYKLTNVLLGSDRTGM